MFFYPNLRECLGFSPRPWGRYSWQAIPTGWSQNWPSFLGFFILGFWKFIGVGSLLVGSRYKGGCFFLNTHKYKSIHLQEFGSRSLKKLFGLFEVNVKDSSFEVQTQFGSSIMHPDYPSSVKTIYFYFAIFQDLLISKIIESIPEMRHSSGKSMHLRGPEDFPKFSGSHQWLGSTTWTHASTHVTWKIVCFTTSSLSCVCVLLCVCCVCVLCVWCVCVVCVCVCKTRRERNCGDIFAENDDDMLEVVLSESCFCWMNKPN